MKIECPFCKNITLLPQKNPYHSGFSNRGFLYCDKFPAILIFDVYNPNYIGVVGDKYPWSLNKMEKKRIENAIKPYRKDGHFRFGAPPRCPVCNKPLLGLLKDDVHFLEIGEVIDGDKNDIWL